MTVFTCFLFCGLYIAKTIAAKDSILTTSIHSNGQIEEDVDFGTWLKSKNIDSALIEKLMTGGVDSKEFIGSLQDETEIENISQELGLTSIEKRKFKNLINSVGSCDPDEFDDVLLKMKLKLKSMNVTLKDIQNVIKTTELGKQSLIQSIDIAFDKIINALKKRKSYLIQKVEHTAAIKICDLRNRSHILENNYNQSQQHVNKCAQLLKPCPRVRGTEKTVSKLHEIIKGINVNLMNPHRDNIQLNLVFDENILIELINDFGVVLQDSWDQTMKGSNIVMNKSIASIEIKGIPGGRRNTNSYQTVFLSNILASGFHHWRFKMNIQHSRDLFDGLIGIWKVNTGHRQQLLNSYFTSSINNGYGFVAQRQKLTNTENIMQLQQTNYGKTANKGSYVDMYLDLDKYELTFGVNGEKFETAFHIDQTVYRAAVSLSAGDTEGVELISYDKYMFKECPGAEIKAQHDRGEDDTKGGNKDMNRSGNKGGNKGRDKGGNKDKNKSWNKGGNKSGNKSGNKGGNKDRKRSPYFAKFEENGKGGTLSYGKGESLSYKWA
eukprot:88339_1